MALLEADEITVMFGGIVALDGLSFANSIQMTTRTAIGVGNEYVFVVLFVFSDFATQPVRYFLRPVMHPRIDTCQVHMIPTLRVLQLGNLPGQRTAGNDK